MNFCEVHAMLEVELESSIMADIFALVHEVRAELHRRAVLIHAVAFANFCLSL